MPTRFTETVDKSYLALTLAVLGAGLLLSLRIRHRFIGWSFKPHPYPPGPPGVPILGNLFDWLITNKRRTWTEWAYVYGDIVHVKVPGFRIVILNSVEMATSMLNTKGSIYSDRQFFYFLGKLAGWGEFFGLMNDGPRVKASRRVFSQHIGSQPVLERFEPRITGWVRHCLRQILEDHSPKGLLQHIRFLTGAIILDITYGYEPKDKEDKLIGIMGKVMHDLSVNSAPGSNLVDIFPWLDRLPSWFPATGYRKHASDIRRRYLDSCNIPYQYTLDLMANGKDLPSVVSSSLEAHNLNVEEEATLRFAAHGMYGAGFDTMFSTFSSFFLFMVLYPEIQARAQAEIDTVVGSGRLPTISDRSQLPYVNAMLREVLRCSEIAPFGIPHVLRTDDVHEGYFIPKGTTVIPNIWLMSRDPRNYKDPGIFDPTRFLGNKPELDPWTYVFGFGRRLCPGRYLADHSLFLEVTTTLATLNIMRATDPAGNEIIPPIAYHGKGLRYPKPFQCKIAPRSLQALALLNGDESEI